jgi:hypothetical protein
MPDNKCYFLEFPHGENVEKHLYGPEKMREIYAFGTPRTNYTITCHNVPEEMSLQDFRNLSEFAF